MESGGRKGKKTRASIWKIQYLTKRKPRKDIEKMMKKKLLTRNIRKCPRIEGTQTSRIRGCLISKGKE